MQLYNWEPNDYGLSVVSTKQWHYQCHFHINNDLDGKDALWAALKADLGGETLGSWVVMLWNHAGPDWRRVFGKPLGEGVNSIRYSHELGRLVVESGRFFLYGGS